MVFIGSRYSWLKQYGINVAAYNIENSRTDLPGWGRLAFSFPSALFQDKKKIGGKKSFNLFFKFLSLILDTNTFARAKSC